MKTKIIFIILFFNNAVFGQVTNVSSGTWSTPAIWSTNLLPVDSTDIILNFDLVIDVNSSCRSLQSHGHNVTINPGVQFSLTGVSDTAIDIDGNHYPTVLIGTQHWMVYNLAVVHYRNGDTIPQVADPTAWENLTTPAWCYCENNTSYGVEYGKLYNWYAVNDPRGLAPAGWRIPSDTDWGFMHAFLDDSVIAAGGKIKETGTVHWDPPNPGDNSSGFTGLPAGYRSTYMGLFFTRGYMAWWWSTTESGPGNARSWDVYNQSYYFETASNPKGNGYSVRCIKN